MELRIVGFVVIVVLYVVLGVLAAIGSITLTRRFSPKAERIFYGLLLWMIAALYLAFAAYFGADTAWRAETIAVLVFVVLGLVGLRLPYALVAGYVFHGIWDLIHELHAHGVYAAGEAGQLTAIPLAYGVFCVTFDLFIAGYIYKRRSPLAFAPGLAKAM
ncbi:MAG TPA: DUF6010 family protein [Terriglobales bacterium]|nr:DUF6010 family protein [Terriglobales bacterium]